MRKLLKKAGNLESYSESLTAQPGFNITALHVAAQNCHTTMPLQVLLELGANADATTTDGGNALLFASFVRAWENCVTLAKAMTGEALAKPGTSYANKVIYGSEIYPDVQGMHTAHECLLALKVLEIREKGEGMGDIWDIPAAIVEAKVLVLGVSDEVDGADGLY